MQSFISHQLISVKPIESPIAAIFYLDLIYFQYSNDFISGLWDGRYSLTVDLSDPNIDSNTWIKCCGADPDKALLNPALPLLMLEDVNFLNRLDFCSLYFLMHSEYCLEIFAKVLFDKVNKKIKERAGFIKNEITMKSDAVLAENNMLKKAEEILYKFNPKKSIIHTVKNKCMEILNCLH